MAAPQTPRTYTVPDAHLAQREQTREESRRARAGILYELVALAPVSDQPEAMALALRLERVATHAELQLQQSWRGTVEDAYARGGMEQAKVDLRALSGLSADAEETVPLTRH